MTPPFEKFIRRDWFGWLLSLDPGQTTGWALWYRPVEGKIELKASGQWYSFPMSKVVAELEGFLESKSIDLVVMEEYRIYNWKAKDHANSTVFTLRLIGALEYVLGMRGIGVIFQGAGQAKGFCTDEKLEDWGFWQIGERHARDAIRHGAYFWCSNA